MNRLAIGSPDKTALLLQWMQEDFAHAFTLIDPGGSLAKLAADRIPASVQDCLYLDLTDIARPPGFNVLADVLPDLRHKLAEDICAYCAAMWETGWGPRSNYILLNTLRLLLDTPGSTLLGIPRVLTDKQYRARCMTHCTDPVVRRFWEEEFEKKDARWREDAIAPVQNKIGALLTSPVIRNIVGQPRSTFALDRGVMIVNLDRSILGDQTAYLLGSLLIARSKGALYVNDLGFFASNHLASLLPQQRFTVAFQFLDELPRKVQQAALAIEDKTVFKTNRDDAERLAFYVGVANPSVLMDLAPSEARTRSDVIQPSAPPSLKRLRGVQARSRALFTRPRAKVEREIARALAA